MDFERSALKALFYDYPIESAVNWLEKSSKFETQDYFVDTLPQLIKWRETAFTTTEAFLMKKEVEQKWLDIASDSGLASLSMIHRPFLLLIHLAKQLLVSDNNRDNPMVRFDCLFRWKNVTEYLGEDVFTTAYKAFTDMKALKKSELFLWPDALRHNNNAINEVLGKGVSDTHAHHNASSDVFAINWLSLTNTLRYKKDIGIRQFQDLILSEPSNNYVFTYPSMLTAASFLRVKFFEFLVLKPPLSAQEKKDFKEEVIRLLKDDIYARKKKNEIRRLVQVYGCTSIKTPSGCHIDYAIRHYPSLLEEIGNPNLVFQGERNLLYQFFIRYQQLDADIWELAPCFYIYILLKTRIRKELVQINNLKGFENFEKYQDRKGLFIENVHPYCDIYDKFMFQTTVVGNADHLESRITPGGIGVVKKDYSRAIFSRNKVRVNPKDQLSFVIHFIKPNYPEKNPQNEFFCNSENVARFEDYRRKSKRDFEKVLRIVNRQKNAKDWSRMYYQPRIVGIDAAGQELFCRPEVFAHLFRYARLKGLHKQTYHAGEDFFDLLDGLRAIDEAIFYLQFDGECRIGHALAAGIDTENYYKKRNFRVICPRQYLLDNCVWCLMRASEANIEISNAFETYMKKLMKELYLDCGYKEPFDFLSYWNSMLLRGNEPTLSNDSHPSLSDWGRSAIVDDPQVRAAMNDEKAKRIFREYHFRHEVKSKGDKVVDKKFPIEIIEVTYQLQRWILRRISGKGIAIESNPTSNIKIGHINNYIEHPLLTRFDPPQKTNDYSYPVVPITVNTDDRGVFSTSVYQELSLIALALYKQSGDDVCNPSAIVDYIDRLRKNGFKRKF